MDFDTLNKLIEKQVQIIALVQDGLLSEVFSGSAGGAIDVGAVIEGIATAVDSLGSLTSIYLALDDR